MDDVAVRHEVQTLEGLLARVEELPEGPARTDALAAIDGLLRVYGEALGRIVALLGQTPEALDALRDDELVSQLLVLHDLAPVPLQQRVEDALGELAPYIGSHGGGIELVSIDDGVARVRLQGACVGCSASTMTLKLAVEEAVLRAAPELQAVEATETHEVTHTPPGPVLPMYDGGGSLPMHQGAPS